MSYYNNQMITSGGQYVGKLVLPPPPPPVGLGIILDTSLNGTFSMTLKGTGTSNINWGDGSTGAISLSPSGVVVTHPFIAPSTIDISSGDITYLYARNNNITSANVGPEFTNLATIDFGQNLLTNFVGRPEWINLLELNLFNNNLTSLTTRPEWTSLQQLHVATNNLSAITTYAAWNALKTIYAFSNASLASFVTHPEWVNLETLSFASDNLNSINTYAAWIALKSLDVRNNNISSVDTFAAWTDFRALYLSGNTLSSDVSTYASWSQFQILDLANCGVNKVDTFVDWSNLSLLGISGNNLTDVSTFDSWAQLNTFYAHNNHLASLYTSPYWTSLQALTVQDNSLNNLNVYSAWYQLLYLYAQNNQLNNVNNILDQVNIIGSSGPGKQLDLSGGSNMSPFGYGLPAKNALTSRSWTVSVNNLLSFVTDIDGNSYAYLPIGTQKWMLQDLKTTKYADGTPIPNLTSDASWSGPDASINGAYCWYSNSSTYGDVYGALYDAFAVQNPSYNLAPDGWIIPSASDFEVLINYLGGTGVAGGHVKEDGTYHWTQDHQDNSSRFAAVGSGVRVINGTFYSLNGSVSYGTSNVLGYAWYNYFMNGYDTTFGLGSSDLRNGISVRCVSLN